MDKKENKIKESSESNAVELIKESLKSEYEESNAEKYIGYQIDVCPYGKCDGSGYITVRENKSYLAKECRCYKEEKVRRKLKNSNIILNYEEEILDTEKLINGEKATLLHPLKNPEPRKIDKRRKIQPEEEPEEYIARNYKQIDMEDKFEVFLKEYKKKSIEYLEEKERTKVKNLIFIGDFVSGIQRIVNTFGRHLILENKKVFAITMKELIESYLNSETKIKEKIKTVDYLILKDLGHEHHTDSGWAISQIKELLWIRYEKKLPIIATTDFFPNELNRLYGDKIMKLINGTYFLIFVENDIDIDEPEMYLNEFETLKGLGEGE